MDKFKDMTVEAALQTFDAGQLLAWYKSLPLRKQQCTM